MTSKLILRFLAIASCALLIPRSSLAVDAPRFVHANGRSALLVEGKPYLILGAQMNNSSEWPSTLPNVWTTVANVHANTLGAPVYWEQLEAQPGSFDFTNVDQLIHEAREHHVHLILLWFGASKKDRKSTCLNSSHQSTSRMPSSA